MSVVVVVVVVGSSTVVVVVLLLILIWRRHGTGSRCRHDGLILMRMKLCHDDLFKFIRSSLIIIIVIIIGSCRCPNGYHYSRFFTLDLASIVMTVAVIVQQGSWWCIPIWLSGRCRAFAALFSSSTAMMMMMLTTGLVASSTQY